MEMFNSLPHSCIVGAEVGLDRLLCSETSSFGAAAGLTTIQLLSGPARWEISKSFRKGLASLPPFRDKETERRRDLPKVPLQREQKPGHSAARARGALPCSGTSSLGLSARWLLHCLVTESLTWTSRICAAPLATCMLLTTSLKTVSRG